MEDKGKGMVGGEEENMLSEFEEGPSNRESEKEEHVGDDKYNDEDQNTDLEGQLEDDDEEGDDSDEFEAGTEIPNSLEYEALAEKKRKALTDSQRDGSEKKAKYDAISISNSTSGVDAFMEIFSSGRRRKSRKNRKRGRRHGSKKEVAPEIQTRFREAVFLHAHGRDIEALPILVEVIKQAPTFDIAYYHLSRVSEQLGRTDASSTEALKIAANIKGPKSPFWKLLYERFKVFRMMQLTVSSLSYLSTGFSYTRNLEAKILTHLKGEDSFPFLNHIFITRDLVKKNESKIAKHRETSEEEIISDDGFLDQGFTRPKVLILLPLRSIAFRVVKRLIQLTPESQRVNVEHLDRFNEEFGCEEGTDDSDEEKNTSKNGKSITKKSSKPSDWQALFGGANNDDDFMLGIKHTRKSIRLYGDFYSSDMIIYSPLKLQMVLVIDHADIISMQNWSFLATVVDHLNRLPSKQHGTNVMRIRPLYLDGHARFYRQSIILSSYLTPEINALFNNDCLNYKGKMKLACEYKGVLEKVLLPVRQIYERFDADSMIQVDDARLEYFTGNVRF